MTAYSHRIASFDRRTELEEYLDEFSKCGWEVVCMTTGLSGMAVLIRKLVDDAPTHGPVDGGGYPLTEGEK